MKARDFKPRHLDIATFTDAGTTLGGQLPQTELSRLSADTLPQDDAPPVVDWSARGETQPQRSGDVQRWLNVTASTTVALECQRCLGVVHLDLAIDRPFRFAATEAQAAALDAESDEDVLVESRNFDVLELIEDELLLALPAIARHDECPASIADVHVSGTVMADELGPSEDDAPASDNPAKPNPFAALAALKSRPSEGPDAED